MFKPYSMFIAGQGHVISHNLIRGFFDGLNISTYPVPPADPSKRTSSIDIHNNVICGSADDGLELDSGVHNLRVYRNTFSQCFMAVSAQPLNGGPAYVYRNVIYDIDERPFKLHCWPAGLLAYNNTIVNKVGFRSPGMWRNCRFVNNLFMGTLPAKEGPISTGCVTPDPSVLDYNGYAANASNILWYVRRQAEIAILKREYYSTPQAFVEATGHEKHGVWGLDFKTFVRAEPDPETGWLRPGHDLRLNARSPAVDAGKVLPNITDGFAGKAPDLGAYEIGRDLPHYGPRPEYDPRLTERPRGWKWGRNWISDCGLGIADWVQITDLW